MTPTISVTKLTDVSLLQRANSFTSGKESHMTLETAYRNGHSPIRTQLFWVELTDIPLFVASQLVRSHVGVQFFQESKRTDRGGKDLRQESQRINGLLQDCIEHLRDSDPGAYSENLAELQDAILTLPNRFDRYTPTNLAFIINAEALINMAHKRLCRKASPETRDIVQGICDAVAHRDPALGAHLVPQCIFRGGICPEPRSCGFIRSVEGAEFYWDYIALFRHGQETKEKG